LVPTVYTITILSLKIPTFGTSGWEPHSVHAFAWDMLKLTLNQPFK